MSSDQTPDDELKDQLPPVDPRIEARRNDVRSRRRLRIWITVGVAVVLVAAGFGVSKPSFPDGRETSRSSEGRALAPKIWRPQGGGNRCLGAGLGGRPRETTPSAWGIS